MIYLYNKATLFLFCFLYLGTDLFAQSDTTDFFMPPQVEDLGDFKILKIQKPLYPVVYSLPTTKVTQENAPSIIAVITSEDIQKMQARDLADVLQYIGGFNMSLDISPSFTFRGFGVTDGRMLVMIDGQPINDPSMGYNFVFQRFALSNIDRIEILKGAETITQGNFASMVTIALYTKKTFNTQNIQFNSSTGITSQGFYRTHVEGYFLNKFKNGISLHTAASYLQAKQSDRTYQGTSYFLPTVENANLSSTVASNIQVKANYKKFNVSFLHNKFIGASPQIANNQAISSTVFNLLIVPKNTIQVNAITLDYETNIWRNKIFGYIKANIRQHNPSYFKDIAGITSITDKFYFLEHTNTKDSRLLLHSFVYYKPTKKLFFLLGGEVLRDDAKYISSIPLPNGNFTYSNFKNGKTNIYYEGFSGFYEGKYDTKNIHFYSSFRVEKYAYFSPVMAYKFALSGNIKNIYAKVIYSKSYKIPTIQNINLSTNTRQLNPENNTALEAQIGGHISQKIKINATAYSITIENPIHRIDSTKGFLQFTNARKVSNIGTEIEASYKTNKVTFHASYSMYKAVEMDSIEVVTIRKWDRIGIPRHRLSCWGNLSVGKYIEVMASYIYTTEKYQRSPQNPAIYRSPEHQANVGISAKNFTKNAFLRDLSIALTCYNVLNTEQQLVSWRNDFLSNVNLMQQSREFVLKLTYDIR